MRPSTRLSTLVGNKKGVTLEMVVDEYGTSDVINIVRGGKIVGQFCFDDLFDKNGNYFNNDIY